MAVVVGEIVGGMYPTVGAAFGKQKTVGTAGESGSLLLLVVGRSIPKHKLRSSYINGRLEDIRDIGEWTYLWTIGAQRLRAQLP